MIACLIDDSAPAEAKEGDARQLAWWKYDDETATHAYWEAASSIEYIGEFVRKEGPFDGIFGFSQGGMIASMVLQHQRTSLLGHRVLVNVMKVAVTYGLYRVLSCDCSTVENPSQTPFAFKFGIFFAAAACSNPQYASVQKVNLPSVHVIGETDAVVVKDRSQALLELYENPAVYYHPGGHYIPTNKEVKDVLREFVKTLQTKQ